MNLEGQFVIAYLDEDPNESLVSSKSYVGCCRWGALLQLPTSWIALSLFLVHQRTLQEDGQEHHAGCFAHGLQS